MFDDAEVLVATDVTFCSPVPSPTWRPVIAPLTVSPPVFVCVEDVLSKYSPPAGAAEPPPAPAIPGKPNPLCTSEGAMQMPATSMADPTIDARNFFISSPSYKNNYRPKRQPA